MIRFFKLLVFVILSCIFYLSVIYVKSIDQKYSVSSIIIEEIDHQLIDSIIVLDYLIDQKIDVKEISESDKHELELLLLKHPFIRKAQVYLLKEGEIEITIKQKQPIARVITNKNCYYIDEKGEKMSLSKKYSARVLVVTGDINSSLFNQILNFTKQLDINIFWKSQITQLEYLNNEFIGFTAIGLQKIYFGDLLNISSKLEKLYCFYDQIVRLKGWSKYSVVNLKYKDQIICIK